MTFQEVKEQFMKPPFKYWILPSGVYHGDFYTFHTLREAKAKVEELVLEYGGEFDILNVYGSKDPYRKGYMSAKILSYDKDFGWYRYTDEDFCLHTAFFFTDRAVEKWDPQLYKKLKEMWDDGKFDDFDEEEKK